MPAAVAMPASFTIDEARPEDLPAIIVLDSKITGIEKPEFWYGFYVPPGYGPRTFYVARVGSAVVGYVVGEVRAWEFGASPCGWLITIGIQPEYRLAGIGTALMRKLVALFERMNVKRMRTMLHIDDHLLMSFFRSHGMTAGPYLQLEMPLEP